MVRASPGGTSGLVRSWQVHLRRHPWRTAYDPDEDRVTQPALPVCSTVLRSVLDVVAADRNGDRARSRSADRARVALAEGLPFALVGLSDLHRLCQPLQELADAGPEKVERTAEAVSVLRGEHVGSDALLSELLTAIREVRVSAAAYASALGRLPPER